MDLDLIEKIANGWRLPMPKPPVGVVLPTSLLDALLRSVPAASVPPLLTATLLTPFLTADYATSLLRERCALDAAARTTGGSDLRIRCTRSLEGAARDISAAAFSQSPTRCLLESEVTGAFVGATLRRRGAAWFKDRYGQSDDHHGEERFVIAASRCIRKCLTMNRSVTVREDANKSEATTLLCLPSYPGVDDSVRHGQLEIKTWNTEMWFSGERAPPSGDEWSVAIAVRCWSSLSADCKRNKKRPRNNEPPPSAYHPRGHSEMVQHFYLDYDDEIFSTDAGTELFTCLQPFLSFTGLGRVFDGPLLVATAVALSQGRRPVDEVSSDRLPAFAPLDLDSVFEEYFDKIDAEAEHEKAQDDLFADTLSS